MRGITLAFLIGCQALTSLSGSAQDVDLCFTVSSVFKDVSRVALEPGVDLICLVHVVRGGGFSQLLMLIVVPTLLAPGSSGESIINIRPPGTSGHISHIIRMHRNPTFGGPSIVKPPVQLLLMDDE